MKDKVLKVISDNSVPKHFCEYGEGIFADINAVDSIAEDVVKLFSIPVVIHQRELLKAFQDHYQSDKFDDERTFDWNIDNFLKAFNCG